MCPVFNLNGNLYVEYDEIPPPATSLSEMRDQLWGPCAGSPALLGPRAHIAMPALADREEAGRWSRGLGTHEGRK